MFKCAFPGLFVYFRSIQAFFTKNYVDFSEIPTRIFLVEGEHGDHLTTIKALDIGWACPNFLVEL